MDIIQLKERDFSPEFVIRASRSSGPGGQNVNKVSSKVELRFNVAASLLLTDTEKEIINEKLAGRINNDGELVMVSQTERTQGKNKENVIEKFYLLLVKALKTKKPRKRSSPTQASVEKRLESKKRVAEKKEMRKKI